MDHGELIKSGYPGLLYGLRNGCDPFHLNSVQVVNSEIAAHIPGVAAGDLLVSIRESSAIAILDPVDGRSNASSLVVPQRSTGHNSCRTAPWLSSITLGVIVQPAGHESCGSTW